MRSVTPATIWLPIALALFALSSNAAAQATIQIIPSAPRYLEPVYARISAGPSTPGYIYGAQASMSGSNISISFQAISGIGFYSFDVALGSLPMGTYTVQLQTPSGPVTTQFAVGPPMPQTAFPGTVPAVNYTAMWWNPLESGWGMSISQGPTNKLFAVWFVYDVTGSPTWYTLEQGTWTGTTTSSDYSGSIYRYTGPTFASSFDPTKVVGTVVGQGKLSFSDASNGRFDWTIGSQTGTKSITRQPIE